MQHQLVLCFRQRLAARMNHAFTAAQVPTLNRRPYRGSVLTKEARAGFAALVRPRQLLLHVHTAVISRRSPARRQRVTFGSSAAMEQIEHCRSLGRGGRHVRITNCCHLRTCSLLLPIPSPQPHRLRPPFIVAAWPPRCSLSGGHAHAASDRAAPFSATARPAQLCRRRAVRRRSLAAQAAGA